MDVRLRDGDVFLTCSGDTEYLCAVQEAAQRVQIAAATAKGAFIYNRALGADYASLKESTMMTEHLDMLIREATVGIADTEVRVTCYDTQRRAATVAVTCEGYTITTEVDLDGNI